MFKLLLSMAMFLPFLVEGATVDLQLTNMQFPGNSQMTVDVQIKSDASFTLGQNFTLASSIRISHDNEGTGAGQMHASGGFSNNPTNYAGNVDDQNGYSEYTLFRVNGSFTVTTSFQTIGTITYTLGSGTNNTHTATLGITSANTNITNSSGVSQTNGTFSGLSSQTLPVSLTVFDLKKYSELIKLNWSTQSEINNDRFEIQRSLDGENFKTIGQVPGSGNSNSQMNYDFSDFDLNDSYGVIYYRLKQIDFDGKFEYSPVRSLNMENHRQSKINWFPNPATNLITVQSGESQLIDIYDISGKTVLSTSTNESNNIDLTSLQKGTYLLLIKKINGEIVQQDKLFIQ